MNKKTILLIGALLLITLWLVACSSATPTAASTPTMPPSTATVVPTVLATNTVKPSVPSSAFEMQSKSAGSVDIDVTPKVIQVGQPMAFEILMNTHSVDLSDDMTQIVILRDDQGKEYQPIAWEGQEPGGHHRGGIIKFAASASKPKYVELVIKGLAKVPERIFRWDLT